MLSIDGLVTGLDTAKIVEGLVSAYQNQIDLLATRKEKVTTEQTSFKGVEARLLSMRGQLAALSRRTNSPFDAKSVAVSNEQTVAAAASEAAVPGVYNIRINQLARSHQIASQGFADPETAITHGTLEISVGSGTPHTITIDGTNNSLQGLADAINSAKAGVTAAVVNDGSGSTAYRLLLTGEQSGAANTIIVNNLLDAEGDGLVRPEFATEVQAATDASVSLGTGAGAITVLSSTNRIDNAISGVTLNLLTAAPDSDVTITVSRNTESAKNAVKDFVDSFNDLMKFIDDQVRYDGESGDAGVLLGNRSAIAIQNEIRTAITSIVPGLTGGANRLSSVGISVNNSGRLVLNQSRLDDVLAGRVPGVTSDDLRRLFALDGQSDNAGVQFAAGSTRTKASPVPYEVDITQAAERARITATSAIAEPVVIDESNRTLSFRIDGRDSGELTLALGSYTADEIAAHVQAVINASEDLSGRAVSVGVVNGSFQVTSHSYGFSSEVTVTGGTALDSLGFDGTETDKGADVVGSFIVNGEREAARGTGRLLMGESGNAHTADLQVRVTLSPSQVQEGADATLTVTRGIASTLDQILSKMLDPVSGRLKTVNDGFQSRIDDIDNSIARHNSRMEQQRDALIRQFVALESAVSRLRADGEFLAAQMAGLRQ